MSQILSQDEVSALLKGVEDGRVDTEAGAEATPSVRACDLTRQERALYGRMPGLDRVFDVFVRTLRGSLEGLLGEIGGVTLGGIELVRYGSWVRRFAPPVSVHMFRLAPLPGNGLMILSPPIAAAALEAAFGGKIRRQTLVEGREYSSIETRVLQRFVARMLEDFREAWESIQTLDLSIVRSESNPAHAVVATEDGVVMVADLRILVDADVGLGADICIPYAALDSLRNKLTGEFEAVLEERGPGWGRQLRGRLDDVAVGVSVDLGGCTLPLRSVLKLQAGDVLTLDASRDEPVVMRVEQIPKFTAVPGIASDGYAVRIVDRVRRAPTS
jgi:flagellar motor switch protein FliM